jgi:hypothetical protein
MTGYRDGQDHRDSGHCAACRWWQSDEHAAAGHDPVGLCEQPELVHFQMQVSADSGCNRFQLATVGAGMERSEGS